METTPQFLSLTGGNGRPITLALGHIVSIEPERRLTGVAHDGDCPVTGNNPDECACRWTYAETGARIRMTSGGAVAVAEPYTDILEFINRRVGAVFNAAGIIAAERAAVDPLTGWQPIEATPAQADEMCTELAADAARDARMDALEGRR